MGCAASKSDDLPAVILCRDRLTFLDEAITHRYVFAKSHTHYTQSLKSIGVSLHAFFDLQHPDFSPVLNLPPDTRKIPQPSIPPPQFSGSHSGSHLDFGSDSDGSCSGSIHHTGHSSSPMHGDVDDHTSYGHMDRYSGSRVHSNYMQRRSTPSVSYEQRPISPHTGYMGEPSNYNMFHNSTHGSSYYANPNFGYYSGSSIATPSTSKQPPPPPSPPKSSSWDFLNFFEPSQSVDFSYQSKTPSRNSKEVRDEEGIPDLEYEDYEQEVVKEVQGTQKFVENQVQSKFGMDNVESGYPSRQSVSSLSDGSEVEVHMGDRKVIEKENLQEQALSGDFKTQGGPREISEVIREIQKLFDRASEAGDELSTILEAGKVPYRKNATSQVSSKMLNVISPMSLVSSPELDEEMGLRIINLSSTLQKCYLWEKKLHDGVKAEEKLRLVHERKCRKLKHLDERGAEASKLDSCRAFIRNLSTEIRIAIQVVDKVSDKINQLRDEELWPQIKELIQGLTRMWKSMLECHRGKCQAIKDARILDAVASQKKFNYPHLDATLQLEHELLNWAMKFFTWIGAQRGYVQALNNWLKKCLLYVPEETADGIVPFSPGRMGAPPLFVICNQWCEALEIISEKEVVHSIRALAENVLHLWERDKDEMRQRMVANKDMERTVMNWEKEDMKIQKGIHALDKMAIMSEDGLGISTADRVMYQRDMRDSSSLQGSLQLVFESLERFAANSAQAYEEILRPSEEVRVPEDLPELLSVS